MDWPADPWERLETLRGVSLSCQELEDAQAANPALSCWLPFSFLLINRLWLLPSPGTRRHCQRIWIGSRKRPALPCATRCTHVFGSHMTMGGAVGWDPGVRQDCISRSAIPSVTSARFSLPSLSLPTCEMGPWRGCVVYAKPWQQSQHSHCCHGDQTDRWHFYMPNILQPSVQCLVWVSQGHHDREP